MDKLANYGSDDDYDDSPKSKRTENRSSTERSTQPCRQASSQVDVNYEEVQMELSEDSSSDTSSDRDDLRPPRADKPKNSRHDDHDRKRYKDDDRHGKCAADDRHKDRESPKSRDYKSKRDDEDDRYRGRDDRHRERGRDDKHRDKYREDRGRDSRYRDDRRSKRSASRERERRSRSPRNHKNKRSSSRDGDSKGGAAYSRRYERASNKMAQLEKLGIEIKTPDCQFITPSDLQRSMDDQKHKGDTDKNRFFMPGITGRFREQIERRKLLWQKKEPEKKEVAVAPVVGTSVGSKVWESTTFAQDSDGKVASKFKRLMGIRETKEEPKSTTDILKKQEEMFSSMEQQYEVARTATHTMRGVGLGFGSFQR